MTLPANAQHALDAFSAAGGWENRARLLMQWGAQALPELPEALRDEAHRVAGCETAVWLNVEVHDERLRLQAASDARLIRGLLAVLIARVNGLDREALKGIDIHAWFDQLGLARQLSPSRTNGMNAVWQRILTASR